MAIFLIFEVAKCLADNNFLANSGNFQLLYLLLKRARCDTVTDRVVHVLSRNICHCLCVRYCYAAIITVAHE